MKLKQVINYLMYSYKQQAVCLTYVKSFQTKAAWLLYFVKLLLMHYIPV